MNRLVLLVVLGASVFCGAAAAEPAATPVRAQLSARNSAVLSAELGAKVRKIHVVEGAEFKKGDVLISLDDALQRSQVERAEAVLVAAKRAFATNERLRKLNSVGQVELDQSHSEVAKAEAELAYAKAILEKCEVSAPFSGRVAELRIHEQEYMQAGQAMLEIIDDAIPEIDFIAPSKWLTWLRVGLPLEISIDETGRAYTARVERIGARVDPVSQSIKIVAAVTEPSPELMAGMSGSIKMKPPE